MVCNDDFEHRHPQDFLRGVPDNQDVPWVRPDRDTNSNTGQPVIDVSPTYISSLIGTQEREIPGGSHLYVDQGYVDANYYEEL